MRERMGLTGIIFSSRKRLACLLVLVMIISLIQVKDRRVQASTSNIYWTDDEVRAEAYGEGQEDINTKTLKIKTAGELGLFAYNFNRTDKDGKYINNGYTGWTIELEADINLFKYKWRPLGSPENPFHASFDGNNHTISNITIIDSASTSYYGFIGYLERGSISNLTVEGGLNTPAEGLQDSCAGGLAGCVIASVINNCTNNIKIDYSSHGNIGGIAAFIRNSRITNCANKADINADNMQAASIGGIVGKVYSFYGTSYVSGCQNTGKISVKAAANLNISSGIICTGGIAGSSMDDSVIYDCRNEAVVSCSLYQAGAYVGGIIGKSFNTKIMNCQSTGKIDITENIKPQYTYIGGITGHSSSADDSSNKGIINCYSRSSIINSAVNNKTYLGGITGYISNSAVNNYFAGDIDSTVSGSAIGLVIGGAVQGVASSFIKYNYYNTDTVSGSAIVTVSGAAIGLNELTDNGGSEAVISVSGSAMRLPERMPGSLADIMNNNLENPVVTDFISEGCYATRWFVDKALNDGYLCNLYYDPIVVLGSDKIVEVYYRNDDNDIKASPDTINIVTAKRTPDTEILAADFSVRDKATAGAAAVQGINVIAIENKTAESTRLMIQVAKGAQTSYSYLWYRDTCVGEITIKKIQYSYWTEKGIRAEAFGAGQENKAAKTLLIKTAAELGLFAYNINTGINYNNWIVTLGNDISLEGYLWEPAGNGTINEAGQPIGRPFSGIFDGNGHTISNISMKTTRNGYYGFFGLIIDTELDGGTCIKNLSVAGNITTANMGNTTVIIGGIAALAEAASISNCKNYIEITLNDYQAAAGGIAGNIIHSSVADCVNYATITEEGAGFDCYAAGIASVVQISDIINCINHGTIRYNKKASDVDYNGYLGGIAALTISSVTADGCINDGNIYMDLTSAVKMSVGGIVGSSLWDSRGGTMVLNGQTTGDMQVTGSAKTMLNIGGIIGQSFADKWPGVINSFSRSNILINGSDSLINAGGIAGITYDYLVNNYFAGSITHSADSHSSIGLIAGKVSSDSADSDSHIDKDNNTCYYLRYNYYPDSITGSAIGKIDGLYKDPYNTGTMAEAVPASAAKLTAGTQGALVDKLNANLKDPLFTRLLPKGHTAFSWYQGSTVNDGYPICKYYVPVPGETTGPAPTPDLTPKPTATPTPAVSPKVTPTLVVATIEASQGKRINKDGSITIKVPAEKLEKCLSDGSVDQVRLDLKLSDDKTGKKQGTNGIILNGDILQSAKEAGKDLSVCIKTSDGKERYTWTFNTADTGFSDVKMEDVNLSLKVEEIKNTPDIKDIMGGNTKGLVLKLAKEDSLPTQAAVRVYVGDQPGVKPGSRIYLYHFNDKSNKLETLPYSSEYTVDKAGYLTVPDVHYSSYVILLKKAAAKIVTSLKDQITVTIDKKTLYLNHKENGSAQIKVNLPVTLELVASLKNAASQSTIGGVTASYSSSNQKVAAVDKNGRITAVEAGKAVITAKLKLYNGKTKIVKFAITVKNYK